jgi:phospholipase/carboxylesterase
MTVKNLMVMLHGYGSNGYDLASLAPFFEPILPDTEFYSPDGIEACEMGVYGFQWFSLYDRSDNAIAKELEAKSSKVREMIKNKAESLGLTEKDVILLGFSQGTMLGLYLALSTKISYKAVIGYSGRLFVPKQVVTTSTPVCLIHGAEDDVVPFESIIEAKDQFQKLGTKIEVLEVANLGHSIDMSGIKFAVEFIRKIKEKRGENEHITNTR